MLALLNLKTSVDLPMPEANGRKSPLYLAGPLFSAAERSFNSFLKHRLSNYFDVYLPQEDGALMPILLDSGMTPSQASNVVFKNDLNAIRQCHVLLILMDGRSVDEGACFELGVAYSLGKTCVGLQTDFRRLALFGNNPMLTGALSNVFVDVDQLIEWAVKWAQENVPTNSVGM